MYIRRSAKGWFSAWRQTKPIFRDLRQLTVVALIGLMLSLFVAHGAFATPPTASHAGSIEHTTTNETTGADIDQPVDLGVNIVHDDQPLKTVDPVVIETPWYGRGEVWLAVGAASIVLVGLGWWLIGAIRRRDGSSFTNP